MQHDIKAKTPGIALTPVLFLRWIVTLCQLLCVMAAHAVFGIEVPAQPLLALIAASFAVNIHAMVRHKQRQVPEPVVRAHLIFDILQLSAFLFFTGGTENPFSILLLAPLAMAGSTLSLYSLCLLIMLTLACLSVMAFNAWPLNWPVPPSIPAQYEHASWVALLFAMVFISFIVWRLAVEGRRINEALNRTHAILEEKRRLTALGALAAAAVHELGSPLSTISLVTREIERELHPDDPLAEDIALLRTESEKCKNILADIARNPTKTYEKSAPMRLDRMLMEIASAQGGADKGIAVSVHSDVPETLPFLRKSANLDYGLGNLVSNALSYARVAVRITVEGMAQTVTVTIHDDGPGFPGAILKTIGQPYISTREDRHSHMGLGIFIAVNLLESTGATVRFDNNDYEGGAVITVLWQRSSLEAMSPPG